MATRSLSLSKCLEPIPLGLPSIRLFPDLESLQSPRIGFEAGDGGAAGMPILIIITLWLLCTLLLIFFLCSFYKALCRVLPTSRTAAAAAAAASATTPVSVTASVEDVAAASRDVLSRLPVFAYSSAAQKKQLNCSVCLADFKEGERGRFLPRCFHCYHVECVDEWLASHAACPVCRASIDAEAAQPPV